MAKAASNGIDNKKLTAYLERIERLKEEQKAIGDDVKDVFTEAKGEGFDPKIMRKVLALKKLSPDKRREEQELTDLYLQSLGLFD
jgi:uncharacterized protein (UPF0335 family)